jgi:hypothetical protein
MWPQKIQNYDDMLSAMNVVLGEALFYGPPFYMILYEAMNSDGGFTAFLADKLNSQFKKIFDVWAQFLGSPRSAGVLTEKEGGWFLDGSAQLPSRLWRLASTGSPSPRSLLATLPSLTGVTPLGTISSFAPSTQCPSP